MATTQNRYSYTIGGNADDLVRASNQGDAAVRKLGGGVQYTRQQMQNLSFQMTDIAVSLQGGQNPLTVLFQQGGQLKDAFGGVGGAVRALAVGVAGMINPVTVAAGAIGALAAAAVQGYNESEKLKDALLLTGNAAGLTEDTFRSLAERVEAATGSTIGNAKELASELAASGRVGAQAFETTAQAAALVQDATGKTASEVAQDFAKMGDDAAKWAAEHNKSWHFIDQDLYRYVKRLQESGREQEAMIEVNKAVIRAFGDQQKNLGYLESAWDGLGKMASKAWDAMLGVGRTQTAGDKLADAQTQLQERLARGPTNELVRPNWEKGNDRLRQQIENMRELVRLENQQAAARARNAAKNDFEPDKPARKGPAYREARDSMLTVVTNYQEDWDKFYADWQKDQAKAYADVLKEDGELGSKLSANHAKRNEDARVAIEQYASDYAALNAELNVSLIVDDRERALAQIELERQTAQAKLDVLKASGEDIAKAQQELDDYINGKRLRTEEDFQKEKRKKIETTLQGSVLDAMDGDFKGILDRWVSLLQQMAAEAIAADLAKALFGNGSGGGGTSMIGSFLGSLFGGSSAPSGGAATGSNYIERDMVTMIHKGEAVIPKAFNPYAPGSRNAGAAGGVTINQTINVGQGVQRAEVEMASRMAKDAAVAEIRNQVVRGDRLWDR